MAHVSFDKSLLLLTDEVSWFLQETEDLSQSQAAKDDL